MSSYLNEYVTKHYVEFSQEEHKDRLRSLYSDFTRLLPDNELGYRRNIEYWETLLLDCSLEGCFSYNLYTVSLDLNSLVLDFLRPGLGRPRSLHLVMDAMKKSGDLMTVEQFDATFCQSSSWLSWLRWRSSSASGNAVHIMVPTVKKVADQVRDRFNELPVKSSTNMLMTLATFRKDYGTFRHRTLTDLDLHLILKYMAHQQMIAMDTMVQDHRTQTVIKFLEPGMPSEIKENEKAMVSIRSTCDTLHAQIDRLQGKYEALSAEAKRHNENKHRPQALSALRRRKQIMDLLGKRLGTLETVENLLLKMESAKDDVQILQAFDQGANALRNMMTDHVSLESVEDTMAKIQEAYEDHQDVELTMEQGMKAMESVGVDDDDEEDLLHELQQLELAQENETKAHAELSSLPAVANTPLTPPVPAEEKIKQDKPVPSSSSSQRVLLTE
ncbi:Snf7-domain-containing protein [Gongronella butleri]|nr:Snf7-domain-containing protein [Gongronella butleri]